MNQLLNEITNKIMESFAACGYEESFGQTGVSNRPDLCQFQCNGALAAAKQYKKAPIMIANEVVEKLKSVSMFFKIEAVMPGFINIIIAPEYLAQHLERMAAKERLGYQEASEKKTIIVDYGGANVAKPLHIGHLRSAVIGECIKRLTRYAGHQVIGDVHLGDWGLQMGLIIEELRERKPDLIYFDETYQGDYPKEAPFTISELEEIYPAASARSKQDESFKERAHAATLKLQKKDKAFTALWNHIMNVSKQDLKKNYDKLNVSFDLWKGESDAEPYIEKMIEDMLKNKIAYESQGAIVVDVTEQEDTKEIPPCLIRKSDGASLYATSDLATIIEREQLYHPDIYIYLADKRQELHFTQVFRTAKKAKIIPKDREMKFLGFGTMNGKDGKPFKTRDGGVMRLEFLIQEIEDAVFKKIIENREISEEEAKQIAKVVGLAALKYGDLSNQASKDYIFDIERFASFEGNTGPYILYTMVRIKSILAKYEETTGKKAEECKKINYSFTRSKNEIDLMLAAAGFHSAIEQAVQELAPHKLCQYIYNLANVFNSVYHQSHIIAQKDSSIQEAWIAEIRLVLNILEICIELLGIEAPDKM